MTQMVIFGLFIWTNAANLPFRGSGARASGGFASRPHDPLRRHQDAKARAPPAPFAPGMVTNRRRRPGEITRASGAAGGPSDHDVAYLIVIAGLRVGTIFRIDRDLVIGRDERADIKVLDDWVSRWHARIRPGASGASVEDLGSLNGTLLNGQKVATAHELQDGDRISVGSTTVLKFTFAAGVDEDFHRRAYDRASRDALTGTHSRQFFDEALRGEISYARRHGSPLALLLVDADHFGAVNGARGRLAGDALLTALARRIESALDADDVLARYDGDAFVVLRRFVSLDQGFSLGLRISSVVADKPVPIEGAREPVHLTVSIGLAHFPVPGINEAIQLVAAAESALASAKAAGGDRVVPMDR